MTQDNMFRIDVSANNCEEMENSNLSSINNNYNTITFLLFYCVPSSAMCIQSIYTYFM